MNAGLDFIRLVLTPEERAAWAKRHDIDAFDCVCSSCKVAVRVDVPFHWKGAVGLTADPCSCGNAQMPFAVRWEELAELDARSRTKRKRSRTKATVIPIRKGAA